MSSPLKARTGLTGNMAHLVECRVKRVVPMLDAEEAGGAAAIDMSQGLAAVNIEPRSVELPAKDGGVPCERGKADDVRRIITPPVRTTNETNEQRR